MEGTTDKFYDKAGNLTHIRITYSDTLLLRLLERTETGSWRQKQSLDVTTKGNPMFGTRAERLAALEAARKACREPLG